MDMGNILPLLLLQQSLSQDSCTPQKNTNTDFSQLLGLVNGSDSSLSGSLDGSTGMNLWAGQNDGLMGLIEQLLAIQLLSQVTGNQGQEIQNTASDQSFSRAEFSTGFGSSSPGGRPVQGGRLTQAFHPGHNGLDFGVVVGTPVHATMNGKVVYAGWNNAGYGNLVIVQNGEYQTYFAHLSKIPVEVGQEVRSGTVVGFSGNTGNSTGPHLHYEVRKGGKVINPTDFTLK